MSEALRIIIVLVALSLGALALDYGSYFQATIFTTLDGSGKGMDANYRDPPYHPFPHPILWLLMAIILIPLFLLAAFNVGTEVLGWVTAIASLLSFSLAGYSCAEASPENAMLQWQEWVESGH